MMVLNDCLAAMGFQSVILQKHSFRNYTSYTIYSFRYYKTMKPFNTYVNREEWFGVADTLCKFLTQKLIMLLL